MSITISNNTFDFRKGAHVKRGKALLALARASETHAEALIKIAEAIEKDAGGSTTALSMSGIGTQPAPWRGEGFYSYAEAQPLDD
ncbi:MAG: hypothetical protein WAP03_27880 [Methylorubrum rhodinum]|uniref:hypothetical protein n=1 Tax=Methylorubrum rhodinum TaxID=29428 RepID=UPI003BB02AF5